MTIRPFSNGSQYDDWEGSNCDRCTKGTEAEGRFTCPIRDALFMAFWDDGRVTPEIAQRMGRQEHEMRYVWPCTEVEWTPEWIAECEAVPA